MADEPAAVRARGRPRSDAARRAIHEAALRLLATGGYRALTMERIAAAAGVGKQTVYRWWPSKAAVVLDALAAHADADIAVPDTGDGVKDLTRFLAATFRALRNGDAPIVRALMAEAQHDATFARNFWTELIAQRRDAMRTILSRAQARGELAADTDLDLLVDLAYGVMWYRLLLDNAPLTDAAAATIAAVVFRAGE
jgi:AcrR family transcriptional regulator